jgi:pyroglutamyl-peptidase
MAHSVLLTGFDRFSAYEDNPSGMLMRRLAERHGLAAFEIPTSFERSIATTAQLIERHQPSAVLLFGLANRAPGFYLEEIAQRDLDPTLRDNDDAAPPTKSDTRPESLPSTLPLPLLESALTDAGLPAFRSDDAGSYVCNHLFYEVVELLQRTDSTTTAGFIHISPLGTTVGDEFETADQSAGGHLDLDALEAGTLAMLAALSRG